MNRKLLIAILAILALSSACNLNNPFKSEMVTPTAAPTQTPVPEEKSVKSLYDDFLTADEGWLDAFAVTTAALPGAMLSSIKTQGGELSIDLQDKETYLYTFYKNPSTADVVIEAKMRGAGNQENAMALVCRAKSDYSAWYEFRVDSQNVYYIYRFDKSLKEAGDNPYVLLERGGIRKDIYKPTDYNTLKVTCKGNQLTLEVNGNPVTAVTDGTLTEAGLVGIGAMSFNILPSDIKVDYFSYGEP